MGERESKNGNARNIGEIDVLWVTAGLGCDGDTIAMTAATQPSIEDIVLGGIPWIPKVNFHNPFLAFANGDDFLQALSSSCEREARRHSFWWSKARFPDETNKQEGYWASMGTDRRPVSPF